MKHLGIAPDQPLIWESVARILKENKEKDGGINPAESIKNSDVCINGMFLNYAVYFGAAAAALESIVNFLIVVQMPDGVSTANRTARGPSIARCTPRFQC